MQNIKKKCIFLVDHLYDTISKYINDHRNICWAIGLVMVFFSIWIRSSVFIGTDPSFYYFTAEKILNGKRYYHDFLDYDFPLCFYLYTIPVMLHNITGIEPITAFYAFITLTALLGIYAASLVLKRTSIYSDGILYQWLIIGMFFWNFFPIHTFQMNEIGTKTLLFVSLITPYLFSFFAEAEHKKLPVYMNIMIGIAAGLAICLKPHYVIFPMVMELYFLIKNRNIRHLFRPLTYAMVIVNLLHLAWLLIYVPEYIFKMIPLITVSYFGIQDDLLTTFFLIILGTQSILVFILLLTYFTLPRSVYNEILLFAVIAINIILCLEMTASGDQVSITYFFGGLLLIKILLDVWRCRHTDLFKTYQKVLLIFNLTLLVFINIGNLTPYQFHMQAVPKVIEITKKLSNGEPIHILSDGNYFPLLFYINNYAYHKAIALTFLHGAQNTKILYDDQKDSNTYMSADKAEHFLANLEIEGMIEKNPKIIFIDNRMGASLRARKKCTINDIEYFLGYDAFRDIFKNYEFYDRIIITDSKNLAKYRNDITNDISVYIRKASPDAPAKPPLPFQGIFF